MILNPYYTQQRPDPDYLNPKSDITRNLGFVEKQMNHKKFFLEYVKMTCLNLEFFMTY